MKRKQPAPAPPVVLSPDEARAVLSGNLRPYARMLAAATSGPSGDPLPPEVAALTASEAVRAGEMLVAQRKRLREYQGRAKRERREKTWLAWSRAMPRDLSRAAKARKVYDLTPQDERPDDWRAIVEYLRRNGE